MKGFTIQHSIELLEEEVKNGGGPSEPTTAADVSYDNTDSGLTAETVQAAIDEVVTSIGVVDTKVNNLPAVGTYSTTETVVGKWLDDRDIYRKVFPVETAITLQAGLWTDLTGVDNTGMDTVLAVTIFQYDTSEFVCAMPVGGYKGTTVVKGLSFRSQTTIAVGSYIAVDYVKPATNNTRKKK